MRVKVKDTFQMTLVLNKAETVYLRDLTQNWFGEPGYQEPVKDAEIREDLFENCKGALEGTSILSDGEDDDDGFTI